MGLAAGAPAHLTHAQDPRAALKASLRKAEMDLVAKVGGGGSVLTFCVSLVCMMGPLWFAAGVGWERW